MFTTVRLSRSFVLCLVVSFVILRPAAPHAEGPVVGRPTPRTIQVDVDLRAGIDAMLQTSATFRSQYRRIGEAPSVVVAVKADPRLPDGSVRARSTFRRYKSGLIVVAVSIAPGSHQEEWVAHEFEHILEQLDGWDLRWKADGGASDIWYSGCGLIETSRAIRAGRTVRQEMRRGIQVSDKLVE
jgi:hypothetical protein